MKKETIAKIFIDMTRNYQKQFEADEARATQNLWWQIFKDCDDEVFQTAAIMVINSQHYFPNVADFRKAIDELLREESVKPGALSGYLTTAEKGEPTEHGRQCAALIRRMLSGEDFSNDPKYRQIMGRAG